MNEHAKLLESYLAELCGRLERREPLPTWRRWRKRALQAASPIALGLALTACEADVEETAVTEECSGDDCAAQCSDSDDNDQDGLVDCDDPDCGDVAGCGASPVYSAPLETCDDGQDNDGDALSDCDDPDCSCGVALYMVLTDRKSR